MIGATLFSGIGAPEVAMPQWQWPWHAEIEPFPNAVMRARHRDTANLGDVTRQGFADHARSIARPDVLVFGSPCQSYSVAGKRLGLDDPRGNLALVALGIVARLEPRWFVFENVPGLLSSSEGRDFGLFLRAVDELGYSGAWTILDAQFAGLAQRRDRVFFVGHSGDWRHPAAVLFEPESLCGHSPPSRETGEGITAPTAGSLNTSIARGTGQGHESDFLIANPLGAKKDGGWRGDLDNDTYTIARSDAGEDGTGRGTPLIAFDPRQIAHPANFSNPKAGDPCHPLRGVANAESAIAFDLRNGTQDKVAMSLQGGGMGDERGLCPNAIPHTIAFSCKDHGADAGALAPTLRAMPHDGSHANAGGQLAVAFQCQGTNICEAGTLRQGNGGVTGSVPFVSTPAVRRLTPAECEALQGFPRGYTAVTYRGKPAADGPRYKALGNAMAVPIVRWILSRIELMERLGLVA